MGIVTILVGYGLDSTIVKLIGIVVAVFAVLVIALAALSHGPATTGGLEGVEGQLEADDVDVFDIQGNMSVDLDTDEVLANGRRADALLVHMTLTNHTAGQVDPLTVDTYRNNHRVAFLTLEVQPVGETFFRVTRAIAIPPDKMHSLDIGCRLPVAFDETPPEPIIAVDWVRVPS
jgi:hypothetical protein